MALSVLQNSFLGGEIAPALYGRIDDKLVAVGAAELTNFLVNVSGSLRKRPGFKFMRQLGDGIFRLIPFRFASDQTLVLVFGNKVMYVVAMGQFVMNGSQPYQVSTPYTDTQLYDLSYSQNADVVTLTSPDVAPYELRRLGATNWEFRQISTLPSLDPPTSVTAAATYPAQTSDTVTDDDMQVQSEQRDVITAQYVVTAVDNDNIESEASGAAVTKCNYYITGATVEVSWSAVPGAASYRVYRYVSGVYGFLAQTTQCSLSDTGTTPDTSQTPPSHREAFIGAPSTGEIISISVVDGGSGYSNNEEVSGTTVEFAFIPPAHARLKWGGGWGWTAHYVIELISPEGQTYRADIPLKWWDYGSSGESNMFDLWPEAWNGKGCPVNFNQELPPITEEWRVRLVESTRYRFEGPIWFEDPLSGWEEDNKIVNRYKDGDVPSGATASGKSLWKTATSEVMTRFAPMWESEEGLSCKIAISSLAGNSVTLDLSISGGTGAKAQVIAVNGVISSVILLSGGRGYSTSSRVTVISKQGSGAQFRLTISAATPAEYPRCSGQFDQRRVFAGSNSNPLKVWMTNPSQQSLMMTHVPLQADDCIEVVAVSEDADMIRHIVGMESLLLFTGSGEMRVGSSSGGITPASVVIRTQSYIGANAVKPVVSGNNVVFISARGGHPYQTVYSEQVASYAPTDIGVRCPHFFDGKDIVDMAICKSPINSLWCCSTDGSLYCATFLPEQGINAWTRVDVQGKVESVCAIAEGTEDHVYITVRRNGTVCLERMSDVIIDGDNNARFVDSFLDAIFTSPQTSITGLNHLDGQTVAMHGDGEYLGTAVVEGGAVTLPKPCRNVAIGLPITSRLITIPYEYANQEVVMREHNPKTLHLRIRGTGGLKYGIYPLRPNAQLYELKRGTSWENVQNPDSKVLAVVIDGNWDRQSQIQVIASDTQPLEIQTVLADYAFQFARTGL